MRNSDRSVGGWVVVAAAAMSLVACGGTTNGEDGVTVVHGAEGRSGERLTAMAYRAGDAVQFRHFHDELLGFDCRFALDGSGTPRCFPSREEAVVYLDSKCQEPAVRRDDIAAGDWLMEWRQDDDLPCAGELESHRDVFVAGEEVYAETISGSEDYELYTLGANGCEPGAPAAKSIPAVHRLTRKSAGELVAGEVETIQTTEGLRIDRVFAQDGAEANIGTRLADGTACYLQRDGSCVAVSETHATGSQCPPARSQVGASGGALVDVGPGPLHLELYEFSSAAGSFRLQALRVGEFLTPRGSSCYVAAAADDSVRCLDEQDQVHETSFYADPECEQRLYAPNDGSIDATGNPQLEALYWVEHGVDYRVDNLRGLKAGHRGPLYEVVYTQCQLAEGFGPPLLLSLGDEVGFERLPQVEDTRLP